MNLAALFRLTFILIKKIIRSKMRHGGTDEYR